LLGFNRGKISLYSQCDTGVTQDGFIRRHSFALLTLPGDTDTWSVTVYISSGDQALKK
jgi:hypothetical protein